MKALGMTCGIGSMLEGARQAGFEIVGNIEWRKYYHYRDEQQKNTFEENFPEAFFVKSIEDLSMEQYDSLKGIDLIMGHPECGNYSTLSATAQFKKTLAEMNKDPGDIPLFAEAIKTFKPRFFIQDNLPKSLLGYSIQEWHEMLPEYDLFPEWISNFGYGNIQKYRNRFFMIGALKSEGFYFTPGELEHNLTTRTLLENMDGLPNHNEHVDYGRSGKGAGVYHDDVMSWGEYREWILAAEDGETIPYWSKNAGDWRKHIGWRKGFKDSYVPVITGSAAIGNPFTGFPFSPRERCRIQGLPDDFILYGIKEDENGKWDHLKNTAIIKQTGKCMPIQFCKYSAERVADHISGCPISKGNNRRIIRPNELITSAKQWFCENVGYANQAAVCKTCWVKKCWIQEYENL